MCLHIFIQVIVNKNYKQLFGFWGFFNIISIPEKTTMTVNSIKNILSERTLKERETKETF